MRGRWKECEKRWWRKRSKEKVMCEVNDKIKMKWKRKENTRLK